MTEPDALKWIVALFKEINVFYLSKYTSVTHSQFLSRGSRDNSKDKVCDFLRRERAGSNKMTVVCSNVLKCPLVADIALEAGWWCGTVPWSKQLGNDGRNLAFRRNCQHQLLQWVARLFYNFCHFLSWLLLFPSHLPTEKWLKGHPSPFTVVVKFIFVVLTRNLCTTLEWVYQCFAVIST